MHVVYAVLSAIYVVFPVDIIPDIIPVLGWCDDAFVALVGVYQYFKNKPRPVAQKRTYKASDEYQVNQFLVDLVKKQFNDSVQGYIAKAEECRTPEEQFAFMAPLEVAHAAGHAYGTTLGVARMHAQVFRESLEGRIGKRLSRRPESERHIQKFFKAEKKTLLKAIGRYGKAYDVARKRNDVSLLQDPFNEMMSAVGSLRAELVLRAIEFDRTLWDGKIWKPGFLGGLI